MTKIRTMGLAAGAAIFLFSGAAFAEGDPAKGEKVFKKCTACHTLVEGKHKVGPSLAGVAGRAAGAAEGFKKYSEMNMAAAAKGLVWNEENLLGYLENPQKFIEAYLGEDGLAAVKKKKVSMKFKLKKEKDRDNVVAYLLSLSN